MMDLVALVCLVIYMQLLHFSYEAVLSHCITCGSLIYICDSPEGLDLDSAPGAVIKMKADGAGGPLKTRHGE